MVQRGPVLPTGPSDRNPARSIRRLLSTTHSGHSSPSGFAGPQQFNTCVNISDSPPKLGQVPRGRIDVTFHHLGAAGEAPSEGELLFKIVSPVRH